MSFDDYAKNWDTDERINRAKIVADEISKSIDIDKNYSAMEFGCGTGLVSFNLYDKFKRINLVDSSKGMIDILNFKISKYKVNNMFTNYLDISDKNSLDMNFDVIYNSMVLHHIHNTASIIKSFYELLNENGYLCIVDLDEEDGSFHKEHPDFDGHNGFNQENLKSILISAGFNDIESNSFFYGEKIIEGNKINYSLFLMKARKHTNP
ncbi:class I SAM-dependent methyltransferase [Clostridium estertheticum]|uniref:class I SAM-dependent DNA methyltransferase n=1 Tax=Clostridium estertheticum TaxID=238834 RepID=UPI0013EE6CEA|nr:class I SAM-dependent methyltransferase [Clostridium estertheticum]MBZ9607556.1 class I SAM-dependent methyltransferase [Clostridium estertheticum]